MMVNPEYNQQSKSRIIVYDIIKLVAIYLVIWGHVILHLQGYKFPVWQNPLYRWICSFHMPLFMMVSGFFSANIRLSFSDYIKKKFRQLILPSLTFGLLFVLSWHYICDGSFFKPYLLCYWFLKSAFICSILYYIAYKFKNRCIGFILTIVGSVFIFPFQVMYMYIPFIVGAGLNKYKDILQDKAVCLTLCSGLIWMVLFINWPSEMAQFMDIRFYKFITNTPPLTELNYSLLCYFYRIIMGVSGSIFIISLFIMLGKFMPKGKFGMVLGKFGSYTLGIYLIQAILLEHIMMKTIDLSRIEWYTFNYILSPVLSVLILMICVYLTEFMNRYRWTKFFLGK